MALLCNVAWAQTPSLELSLLSKFAGATWYNAAGAVATSGWTNKLVTTNTSPAITLQAPEGKNVLGWYSKTSGRWPALQAGNVYTITIPEGYGFTGYTLTTQATTSGNKSTFTYTTAEGQVESVTQQTSDSKVIVTGLELISTITIDLTNYNVSSTSGIAISGLDVTYSPKSMHEVTGLELMSYPYALSDADANKIFASENLTIVADVTTASSMSGRGAIVSGSDPTQPKRTSATKTDSPYFAYGHNGTNPSYLASSLDGDRFGGSTKFATNTTSRVVIVANKTDNIYKLYIDGVEKHSITFPTSDYAFQTFNQFADNASAKVYIGGGVTKDGVQDIFDGTIHAVRFYGTALSSDEISALGNEVTKSTTAKVYIAADARQADGSYAKHYLYNNNGTLATKPYYEPCDDKFTWTATRADDGTYSFENGTGKKLGFNTTSNLCIADEAVSLNLCPTNAVHAGSRGLLRIGDDSEGKWVLTKADGSAFNRQGSKVNDGTWTSDYVFVPCDESERMLVINGNVDGTATYNGETKTLPAVFYVTGEVADENATVIITSNDKTKSFTYFTDASDAQHETLKLTSLAENATYTAHFDFGLTDGAKYYIYAYTQPTTGIYVNRYLYKGSSGNVATSADLIELFDNYMWTVTKEGEGYKLTNAAGGELKYNSSARFYLGDAADVFKVDPTNVATQGKVSIVSGSNVYVATSANGQAFNQHTGSQANNTSWTTDYMFIPVEEPEDEYVINFVTSSSSAANATVTLNGETQSLPASFRVAKTTANAEVTVTVGNADYTFAGLYEYESSDNLGATYTFVPQEHRLFTVEYTFNLISSTFANAVPVQIYNDDNNTYGIKLNATADYVGKAVNSGTIAHKENEQWYLVGSESNFKMYSRTAGEAYAVKVAGTGEGSAATMVAVADATPLQLKAMEDGSYRIAPASSTDANLGFNMYGGVGYDIKLFNGTGSEWRFRRMPKNPLTVNVVVEGEQPLPTNTRVAELSYNNASGTHIITKDTESLVMYVPFGDVALTQPWLYRGYTFDGFYVGEATTPTDFGGVTLTDEGLTITAKYGIDEANDYQYLYWYRSEDTNAPYRIPAITVTKSGKVLAISDYRTCGDDIGMGEVDIMFRRSTESYDNWDKKSWTTEDFVADGQGGNENVFNVGFGDAAVVSDRESNKTLVMAVAGKQRFNWASATSHNSVARIVTENDGDTWEITDLTSQFFGDENVLFPGFFAGFITSGRILQSSTYKAPGAQYYRIYGVAATNDDGNSSYPNYALYSDDFGATWKMLGGSLEKGMCCDAGNETTIEELPNGDLVVSVRKSGGRYFNIFNYGTGEDDKANGIGEWEIKAGDTKVTSNFGSADCNGELLRVGNVLLHSHPKRGYQGKDRSNVAIFYKVLDPEKDYTAAEIAAGWQELTQVSFIGSAYSTMTLLPDGKTVGFLYEEDPDNGTFAYCIVYKPIDLTELLTAEAQKEAFVVNSTIGQYEIGTFYANDAMVVPEGVTAYVATAEPEMDGATGTLTMTKVEDGIIPAQTGALICGAQGTYTFKLADTEGETDVYNNLMPGYAGIYEHQAVALKDGYTTYVLTVEDGVAGFYKKEADFKVYNNKAYLQVPSPAAEAPARMRIRFDMTTEIEEATGNDQQPTVIYDLQGRHIINPTKGMYIINGKKIIVK